MVALRPLVLGMMLLIALPAFAQVDFSGEWAPRFHEDQPERVPGPELGEEVERPKGYIPHWLPGTNPDLKDFAAKHNLPFEATRGGAETMYPDYRFKIGSK